MKYNTISEKDQLKEEKAAKEREQYLLSPTKINRIQTRDPRNNATPENRQWVTHTVEPMSNQDYSWHLQDLISEVGFESTEYREILEYQKTPEDIR